jgi:hypothetical protein
MPAQYQFTFEELVRMVMKSAAMRSFKGEELRLILEQSRNPQSQKAQALFAALDREQKEYKNIRSEYINTTGKIMQNFNNDVTGIKNAELHKVREKAEEQAAQKEEEIAKSILQNIK